jgi:hypothetical protein
VKRLLCLVLGHRWRALAVNPRKNANLYHLSPRAGWHEVCDRCGEEWNDLWSPFFGDDVIVIEFAGAQPLPMAKVRR